MDTADAKAFDSPLALHVVDNASRLAGGMYESVRGLARGLEDVSQWRAGVTSVFDQFSEEDSAAWAGLDLKLVPRGPVGPIGSALRLRNEINNRSPDIVHVHGIWGVASMAASLASRPQGNLARLVISPRGMLDQWALERSSLKKAIARQFWTNRLFGRVGCFHALNEAEAASIAAQVPGRPICIIPNGVSVSDIQSESSTHREKSVLFLGRLHPKKGISELIDGWTLSGISDAGWRLDIAGWDDGGYEAELRTKVAQLGQGGSVRLLGPAFGEYKKFLFCNASLFVLPSYSEGLPMAVLEAWSYRLPVLMTEHCNLPEGFEHQASLRCQPNAESIASELRKFAFNMDEEARGAIGNRGRSLVENRFSWNTVGEKMIEVYNWVLGGESPRTLRD